MKLFIKVSRRQIFLSFKNITIVFPSVFLNFSLALLTLNSTKNFDGGLKLMCLGLFYILSSIKLSAIMLDRLMYKFGSPLPAITINAGGKVSVSGIHLPKTS